MKNLWFAQTSFGLDTTCTIFKKMDIFAKVSDSTIHKIVYELMEILVFSKPALVYNDLSYYEEYEKHKQRVLDQRKELQKDTIAHEYLKYTLNK